MWKAKLFAVVLLQTLCLIQAAQTPGGYLRHKNCHISDTDCLTNEANAILQDFVNGIPDLNIKKLDVMKTEPVIVKLPKLDYELTNVEVTGLKDAVIDKISINKEFQLLKIGFHTNLVLTSKYKVDGLTFHVPIHGEGNAKIILKNLQIEIIMPFAFVKDKEGKTYMDIKRHYYGFNVLDGVEYKLEKLYSGDVDKTDSLNSLFTENWRTVITRYGPYFLDKIVHNLEEAIKIYLGAYPLENFVTYD